MRKLLTLAVLAIMATGANAQEKKADSNKPVFTTVKSNPITSVKNQNRSGTSWDF